MSAEDAEPLGEMLEGFHVQYGYKRDLRVLQTPEHFMETAPSCFDVQRFVAECLEGASSGTLLVYADGSRSWVYNHPSHSGVQAFLATALLERDSGALILAPGKCWAPIVTGPFSGLRVKVKEYPNASGGAPDQSLAPLFLGNGSEWVMRGGAPLFSVSVAAPWPRARRTLDQRIRDKKGEWLFEERRAGVVQTLTDLGRLHDKGLIHSDVKPANSDERGFVFDYEDVQAPGAPVLSSGAPGYSPRSLLSQQERRVLRSDDCFGAAFVILEALTRTSLAHNFYIAHAGHDADSIRMGFFDLVRSARLPETGAMLPPTWVTLLRNMVRADFSGTMQECAAQVNSWTLED